MCRHVRPSIYSLAAKSQAQVPLANSSWVESWLSPVVDESRSTFAAS